jgi:hypothetical protein
VRRKQFVWLSALLVGALVAVGLLAQRESGPTFRGKPVDFWLNDLERWDGDTNDIACLAFREMGTNAIPALMEVIQSGGPPVRKFIRAINRRQSIVNLPFGDPWHRTLAAFFALRAMGANARPALPALTNLLFHTNEIIGSAMVLAGIGPEGVRVALTALTNQNDFVRHAAASGLAWARSDSDLVVPALIARLGDSSGMVHRAAIYSLGELHAKPELALPALMNDFPGADPLSRQLILLSFGRFQGAAKMVLPLIMSALKDNEHETRDMARRALGQIDPEAAVKAGVE